MSDCHEQNVKLVQQLAEAMKQAFFLNPPQLVEATRKTVAVQTQDDWELYDEWEEEYFSKPFIF